MISPETLLQNRYLVQKQVGKGGMGVVYMATDQRFGSTVALKEIFLDAPHLRKAFEREARLLNHLRHPALPRVSDHFTDEDGQFIVMEFIPGVDLWEMLKEKRVPFPLANVLEWGDQLLDALEYLHGHDPAIVHRDIKPQNLKLTERGAIVLLDFGLAKGTPSHLTTATSPASVFGYSFNYAPLEQMQAAGTDPRSDLYSLGATLYHLMTNVTPPDALSRATAVLNGEPDPLRPADKVQAQVTEPVARVLAAALAQNAAKRPQTAAEMRAALRAASKQNSVDASPPIARPIAVAGFEKQTAQLTGPRVTKPVTSYQPGNEVSSSQHAPTVVQPAFAASRPQPSSVHSQDRESVSTRLRSSRTTAPQHAKSGRIIGILTSVALLMVVAAAVYTFTRQPLSATPNTQNVASPVDVTTSNVPASDQAQTPSLSPELPASSQQSGRRPNDSPQNNPAADSPNSQAEAPDNSAAAATQLQSRDTTAPASDASGLTPEAERARQADEIRRQRREREEEEIRNRKAEMDRERAREAEMQRGREMRRHEPPPPRPGFPPPPRRDGPPPH